MINLIICILSLVFVICLIIWENKAKYTPHSKYLLGFALILRILLLFSVGFFASESVKYFSGLSTVIF